MGRPEAVPNAGVDARATMWDGRPRPSECRKRLGNWQNYSGRRKRLPLSSFLGASVKGVDAHFPLGRRLRDSLSLKAAASIALGFCPTAL
jgi:hypothetical protein